MTASGSTAHSDDQIGRAALREQLIGERVGDARIRGSMSRMARRRNASSTMLRRRVWSGSSMVSMLSAIARTMAGIHHRTPATPPSLRSVNVSLSFKTRPAMSCVVVIQILPMIGNLVSTIGPSVRSRSMPAAGSRK